MEMTNMSEYPFLIGFGLTIYLIISSIVKLVPTIKPLIETVIEPFQKMGSAMEMNADSLERSTRIIEQQQVYCKNHQDRIVNKAERLAIQEEIDPEQNPYFLDMISEVRKTTNE